MDQSAEIANRKTRGIMNIKSGQISSVLTGLNKIGKIDMPVKVSYWFARIASKLQPEVEVFEGRRVELLKKYAKTDENNELVLDESDQAQLIDEDGFRKEYAEIANEDIEIKIDSISIDDLGKIDISPAIISMLLPLLADHPSEEDKKTAGSPPEKDKND